MLAHSFVLPAGIFYGEHMNYLTVPNLEKYQAYKDDRPVHWIKLYLSIMSDYKFSQLPDNTKAHLILLWAFAAGHSNEIIDDPKWIKEQLGLKQVPDIKRLTKDGFLVYKENEDSVRNSTIPYDTVPREEKSREEIEESRGDPPKPPKGVCMNDWMALFENYSEAYPAHKRNKGVARKSWAKLKRSMELYQKIMDSVEAHKQCDQWLKDNGQFIPGAAVFLNQERWENDPNAKITPAGQHPGSYELGF